MEWTSLLMRKGMDVYTSSSSPSGVFSEENKTSVDKSKQLSSKEAGSLSPKDKMERKLSYWTRKMYHFQSKTSMIVSFWDDNYVQVRLGFGAILQAIHEQIMLHGFIKNIGVFNVKFMTKTDILNYVELKIFWLPVDLNLDIVKEKLGDKLKINEISYTYITDVYQGNKIATSPINVIAEFKDNGKLTDIPHKLDFGIKKDESMWGLITMRGRAPTCLKCGMEGHTRPFCPLKKCTKCRKTYKEGTQLCDNVTYANVAKAHLEEDELIDLFHDETYTSNTDEIESRKEEGLELFVKSKNNETSGDKNVKDNVIKDVIEGSTSPLSTIGATPDRCIYSEEDTDIMGKDYIVKKGINRISDSSEQENQSNETSDLDSDSDMEIEVAKSQKRKNIDNGSVSAEGNTRDNMKGLIDKGIDDEHIDNEGENEGWKLAITTKRRRKRKSHLIESQKSIKKDFQKGGESPLS